MQIGTCGLCGLTDVEIDKEHIWPQWLSGAILAGRQSPRVQKVRDGAVLEPYAVGKKPNAQGLGEYTLDEKMGIACKLKCNSGWMNDLEGKVKPFLEAMATTDMTLSLDLQQRSDLAVWIVKTAMVVEYADSGTKSFPGFSVPEREYLKNYWRPPTGTRIWIFRSIGVRPAVFHGQLHLAGGGSTGGILVSAYSLTFLAGQFGFQLVRCGIRDWPTKSLLTVNDEWDDALIPLTPETGKSVTWPARQLDDDGSRRWTVASGPDDRTARKASRSARRPFAPQRDKLRDRRLSLKRAGPVIASLQSRP